MSSEVTTRFEDALVRAPTPPELWRALGVAAAQLLRELGEADADLARRLEGPLLELALAAPDAPLDLRRRPFSGERG